MLNGGSICYKSRRQRSTAQSTAEAEYMAAADAANEAIWLRLLLKEIGFAQTEHTLLYEDNRACIKIAEANNSSRGRVKHIDVRYHVIRDYVRDGKIKLVAISTHFNVADVFTKPLCLEKFSPFADIILGYASPTFPQISFADLMLTI
jgi:hypothetical protein